MVEVETIAEDIHALILAVGLGIGSVGTVAEVEVVFRCSRRRARVAVVTD